MEMLQGILSRLWWGGEPDEKNPISGMSLRDIHHVQKSWAKINADASGNGFLIFTRIFAIDAESKALFGHIAIASEQKLARSPVFRAHVINVMASIDTAVQYLQQAEVVIPLMRRLGEAHVRKRVKRRHFEVFREVFVQLLQNDLHTSAPVLQSWALFVEFIYRHIFTEVSD